MPFRRKTRYLARLAKKFRKTAPNCMIARCGAHFVTSSIHGYSVRLIAFSLRRKTIWFGFVRLLSAFQSSYEVSCSVPYLLKSGCQWRMLPSEFPKWRTAHSCFTKWSEPGLEGFSVLERALKNAVGEARARQGRKSSTSFLNVDARSIRNTDGIGEKGCDAGKKVSGIKRHIAVDAQGLPHAIAVTTANVTRPQGIATVLGPLCAADLRSVRSILADGGYVGQPFAQAVEESIGARVQIAKRSELHTFAVMPRR